MTDRTELNIKMDLLRVAKTALDTDKAFDIVFTNMFLDTAIAGVEQNLKSNLLLKKELIYYKNRIPYICSNKKKRVFWGEGIMSIASRLRTM